MWTTATDRQTKQEATKSAACRRYKTPVQNHQRNGIDEMTLQKLSQGTGRSHARSRIWPLSAKFTQSPSILRQEKHLLTILIFEDLVNSCTNKPPHHTMHHGASECGAVKVVLSCIYAHPAHRIKAVHHNAFAFPAVRLSKASQPFLVTDDGRRSGEHHNKECRQISQTA